MGNEDLRGGIPKKLDKKVASDPKHHNVYLLIHSDNLGIHWLMAAGSTDEVLANPNQPIILVQRACNSSFSSWERCTLYRHGVQSLRTYHRND